MVWVKSEYAGELAVLSAWATFLLPWSFTFAQLPPGQVVIIRFVPLQLQFLFNFSLGDLERPLLAVWEVPGFQTSTGNTVAAWLWVAAAALLLAAVALSVAYYLREERVESMRVDPVRLMGGLLTAAGVATAVATVVLWRYQTGLTVPVGVFFQLFLGVTLLRVERT